eukprot:1552243-Prymnesium_polylepis.1
MPCTSCSAASARTRATARTGPADESWQRMKAGSFSAKPACYLDGMGETHTGSQPSVSPALNRECVDQLVGPRAVDRLNVGGRVRRIDRALAVGVEIHGQLTRPVHFDGGEAKLGQAPQAPVRRSARKGGE